MNAPQKLSPEEISQHLTNLPRWSIDSNALVSSRTFGSFSAAMIFVNAVAELAEKQNHHPDITVSYRTVHLSLSTHDAGGITEKDILLAHTIDALPHE